MDKRHFGAIRPLAYCALLLLAGAAQADCTSRPNIFGGQDVRCADGTRISSRPNIHGGYDWSDGTRSRANIFGGVDIKTPAGRTAPAPAAVYDPGKRLR